MLETTTPMPIARRNSRRLILPDCLSCSVLIVCSFSVVRSKSGSDTSSAKYLLEFLRVTAMLGMRSMSVTRSQAGRPHKKRRTQTGFWHQPGLRAPFLSHTRCFLL